jgi:hypothetical protein
MSQSEGHPFDAEALWNKSHTRTPETELRQLNNVIHRDIWCTELRKENEKPAVGFVGELGRASFTVDDRFMRGLRRAIFTRLKDYASHSPAHRDHARQMYIDYMRHKST